jgi:hypothetical protein
MLGFCSKLTSFQCKKIKNNFYTVVNLLFLLPSLGAVYNRVFCVRFSVRDGAAAHQFPLLFMYVITREKQRKLVGSGAITDGETDAKNASVDGPL